MSVATTEEFLVEVRGDINEYIIQEEPVFINDAKCQVQIKYLGPPAILQFNISQEWKPGIVKCGKCEYTAETEPDLQQHIWTNHNNFA